MPVYGDQLAFFQEQFRYYDYFTMKPLPSSGYTPRESLGKVRGVFQYLKSGELRREEDTLADINVPTLWTRQKLNVGNYFIQKDDELYRIVNPADWLFEGGFCVYVLETVNGNTDVQKPFDYVDIGQDSYG